MPEKSSPEGTPNVAARVNARKDNVVACETISIAYQLVYAEIAKIKMKIRKNYLMTAFVMKAIQMILMMKTFKLDFLTC